VKVMSVMRGSFQWVVQVAVRAKAEAARRGETVTDAVVRALRRYGRSR